MHCLKQDSIDFFFSAIKNGMFGQPTRNRRADVKTQVVLPVKHFVLGNGILLCRPKELIME